jgi:hypothetical protein
MLAAIAGTPLGSFRPGFELDYDRTTLTLDERAYNPDRRARSASVQLTVR